LSNEKFFGIQKLENFRSILAKGNFKFIYVFSDGTYLKKKGKYFYRKSKKIGPPSIIISSSNFEYIPEIERRLSIADDINQDLIWIQKTKERVNGF